MTTEETKDSLAGFFAAAFNVVDMEYLEDVVSVMTARWDITDRPGYEKLTGIQP